MRAALWLLALFGVAVAAALFAGSNEGTVTLFWPPYRLDLSLNLVVVLLVLAFTMLYGALRGLAALLALPRQARRWRLQQKERAMYGALLDALAQLMAGRFLRARKAAAQALQQESAMARAGEAVPHSQQLRALAHWAGAEASQALQDAPQREHHLQQALEVAPAQGNARQRELCEGLQLCAARWALEDRQPQTALQWLQQLPQGAARRTLALRIKLKAARRAHHTQSALETARLLGKHRAFSATGAQSIVRGLAIEWLDTAHDVPQLHRVWQSLDDHERAQPELALHACQRLVALGGDAPALRQWLLPVWQRLVEQTPLAPDHQLLKLVRTVELAIYAVDTAWLARMEALYQAHPRDARWQYLAGLACLQHQLWGKAQQLLAQAAPQLHDPSLCRHAWCRLAELAQQRGDAEAAALAWREAALTPQR